VDKCKYKNTIIVPF